MRDPNRIDLQMVETDEEILINVYGPTGLWLKHKVPNTMFMKKEIEEVFDEVRQDFLGRIINDTFKHELVDTLLNRLENYH